MTHTITNENQIELIQFVNSATDKAADKNVYKVIHIDRQDNKLFIAGSDGNSLHVVEHPHDHNMYENIENGSYSLVVNKKKIVVIEKMNNEYTGNFNIDTWLKFINKSKERITSTYTTKIARFPYIENEDTRLSVASALCTKLGLLDDLTISHKRLQPIVKFSTLWNISYVDSTFPFYFFEKQKNTQNEHTITACIGGLKIDRTSK
jgi:hypothetical protein